MSEVAGRLSAQFAAAHLLAHQGGRGVLAGGVPGVRPARAVVIGAILAPGALAPHVVRREHLALLGDGAVVVDVSIDQGGCLETSRPTTHYEPTFVVDGVVHNCVANMPGAVPSTSTQALMNATLPHVVEFATRGVAAAVAADPGLADGVNVAGGQIVHAAVAAAHGETAASFDAAVLQAA